MKPLAVNFNRGYITESSHEAIVLIGDMSGRTLLSTGHNNKYIFPRSSIKIFQAIPFVSSDAVDKYKLNSKIVALSCASHRGELYHINELERWLHKIKVSKSVLKCGSHYPLNLRAKEELIKKKNKINQLHNNCAGKHLAMISSCLMQKYELGDYLNINHPHQIKIREIFEKFSEVKIKENNFGIDGCSAPQYAFRMKDVLKSLTNLNKSYNDKFKNSYEVKLLINAILDNPLYIGGSDSLDSKIINISNKKIFCKGGAEGVVLFIDLIKNISGVIKITDGNERAIPFILFELFEKFKIMSKKKLEAIKEIYNCRLLNHANIVVGSVNTNI